MYKTQRNYENVQRALFNGVGCYEIPMIEPTQFDNAELNKIAARWPAKAVAQLSFSQ